MTDRAIPNLPSRDLLATVDFYSQLGFEEKFRDDGWLILERGSIQVEFFPCEIDPKTTIASCCIRVANLDALYQDFSVANLSNSKKDTPRISAPEEMPWGKRMFVVVDPDGNLIRCISE